MRECLGVSSQGWSAAPPEARVTTTYATWLGRPGIEAFSGHRRLDEAERRKQQQMDRKGGQMRERARARPTSD